jgi:hypothetical protein
MILTKVDLKFRDIHIMNEKANFYQSTFGLFFSVDLRRESLLVLSVNQKKSPQITKSTAYFFSIEINNCLSRQAILL